MKPISSSTSGLELNTDRIAAASKQRPTRASVSAEETPSSFQAAAFRREMPMTRDAGFVEIDGKKYFLNAPRGTYVNIIV